MLEQPCTGFQTMHVSRPLVVKPLAAFHPTVRFRVIHNAGVPPVFSFSALGYSPLGRFQQMTLNHQACKTPGLVLAGLS